MQLCTYVKVFSMFPLWSLGEGTNFENAFFIKKTDVRFFLLFFAPATHVTDVNEIWQDERD